MSKALQSTYNKDDETFSAICDWIINTWGGIPLGDRNRLEKLIDLAIENPLDLKFERISSTSKVLAFFDPSNFAIYDTRVAYSLNWILLKNGYIDGFFPLPEGRNSKLNAFDIEVLINLVTIKSEEFNTVEKNIISKLKKKQFIDNDKAYKQYIELLKAVHEKLYNDQNLYLTEMLLFSIADKQICSDIVNTVNIKLNK